jgi:MFS family permease
MLRNTRAFFSNPTALAIGLVFATDSVIFGSWVARIPFVKYALGLNDAELGIALFMLPVGLMSMNPFTGRIVGRFGASRVCLWSAWGLCASVLIPISATHVAVLGIGLAIMGAFAALINVAMNTCATNLERSQGIRIMSACHGMWSLGGMTGSALAGLYIAFQVPALWHMLSIVVILAVLTYFLQAYLTNVPESPSETSSSFVRPSASLLVLIFIGLTVSMGEGMAFDWSAVYLREIAGAAPSIAALGFAFFSLAMTIGRFLGDTIIPRYGVKPLLIYGGLVGTLGIVLAVAFPSPVAVLGGFLLLGLGCSLAAPMLYSLSMQQPGIAPAAGLATFATFSFMGFLAGPPLIGFIAEAYGLAYGVAFVGILLLLGVVATRWARV